MFNWFLNKVAEGVNNKLLLEIDNLNAENEKLQEAILKLQTLSPTPEDNVAFQSHKEAHDLFNEWRNEVLVFAQNNGMYCHLDINSKFLDLLNKVPVTKLL